MTDDPKARADRLLETALAGAAVADPRPLYRPVLRHLRERDPAAFARALEHYEQVLVPAAAGAEPPLSAWARYGRLLAELLGPGRTSAVDGTGRAGPESGAGEDALVLYLPDEERAPALVLRCPREPSAAQRATLELLAAGRVTASAYD